MPRCDALVLRLHPDDPDLLEIMLREGDFERRVARAPSSNPRAWEWTTPPSWLRAGAVEALLDQALSEFTPFQMLTVGQFYEWDGFGMVLAEVPVSAPVGSLARVARQQAAALATLGARTGEFVQVCA